MINKGVKIESKNYLQLKKEKILNFFYNFRKGEALRKCVENSLLKCKDPTPSNVVNSLLLSMQKAATPCKGLIKAGYTSKASKSQFTSISLIITLIISLLWWLHHFFLHFFVIFSIWHMTQFFGHLKYLFMFLVERVRVFKHNSEPSLKKSQNMLMWFWVDFWLLSMCKITLQK